MANEVANASTAGVAAERNHVVDVELARYIHTPALEAVVHNAIIHQLQTPASASGTLTEVLTRRPIG